MLQPLKAPNPLQVDFQSTILSRFDMIFILRDLYDEQKDLTLAKHIIDIHVQGGATTAREPPADEISVDTLKRCADRWSGLVSSRLVWSRLISSRLVWSRLVWSGGSNLSPFLSHSLPLPPCCLCAFLQKSSSRLPREDVTAQTLTPVPVSPPASPPAPLLGSPLGSPPTLLSTPCTLPPLSESEAERWPRLTRHDLAGRYVAYARAKCMPRLNAAAMATLENYYVSVRQDLHRQDMENQEKGRAMRAVPITVRQLEAVVRISESVAKMRLSDVATESDVAVAIHMFTVSTLEAAKMGEVGLDDGGGEDIQGSEDLIRARIAIGARHSKKKIVDDIVMQGIDERSVRRAMNLLIRQGVLSEENGGKILKRVGG